MLYSVFRSLNLDVAILPVIEGSAGYGINNPQLGVSTMGRDDLYDIGCDTLADYLKTGDYQGVHHIEIRPTTSDDYTDIDRRWKLLLMTRKVQGMKSLREYAQKNNIPLKPVSFYDIEGAFVGSHIHPYHSTDLGQDEDEEVDKVNV